MLNFIVNPHARTDKGLLVWRELEKLLQDENVEYKAYVTTKQGDATEFARKLCEEPEEDLVIVMVGGDGTANEILQGIDTKVATFGYIPVGSSNDLARGLGIPSDEKECLRRVLSRENIKEYDTGVTFADGQARRFFVGSGIGFDADVCKEALTSKIKGVLNKLHLGKLTYGLIAIKLIFGHRKTPMDITVDENETIHYKDVLFAAAMNHPYEGGGIKFAPSADGTDGEFDLIVAHDLSPLKTLKILPGAYKGEHLKYTKNIDLVRCKKVEVKASKRSAVHTDGEVPFFTEKFTCNVGEKIRIII